jgi:hypothetical protein
VLATNRIRAAITEASAKGTRTTTYDIFAARQNLERNAAIELGIPRAVDLAHPARADGADDPVRPEVSAGCQGHEGAGSYRVLPFCSPEDNGVECTPE